MDNKNFLFLFKSRYSRSQKYHLHSAPVSILSLQPCATRTHAHLHTHTYALSDLQREFSGFCLVLFDCNSIGTTAVGAAHNNSSARSIRTGAKLRKSSSRLDSIRSSEDWTSELELWHHSSASTNVAPKNSWMPSSGFGLGFGIGINSERQQQKGEPKVGFATPRIAHNN